jgi:hypothetical protein
MSTCQEWADIAWYRVLFRALPPANPADQK